MLLVSNLVTAAALVLVLSYYRVPQKAFQRLAVEGRIPVVKPAFQNNRFYEFGREIHQLYRHEDVRTVVFGDSLIGNVSMTELFDRKDVVGRAIFGDTSAGLLHRLNDYAQYSLKCIVLLIGTNDFLTGVSKQKMLENYAAVLTKCQSLWPEARIVVLTIPPVAPWATQAESLNQTIAECNGFLELQADLGDHITVIPFAKQLMDSEGYLAREMTNDGVHLNANAFVKLKQLVAPVLPN